MMINISQKPHTTALYYLLTLGYYCRIIGSTVRTLTGITQGDTEMLKYEGIEIGSRIRAYDHKPSPDRKELFVEGEVIRVTEGCGFKAYEIFCEMDSNINDPSVKGSRVYQNIFVPMGISFMEYDNRVQVVAPPCGKVSSLNWG